MFERFKAHQLLDEWRARAKVKLEESVSRMQPLSFPSNQTPVALIGVRRSGKTTQAIQLSQKVDSSFRKDLSSSFDDVIYMNFEDPAFYLDPDVRNLELLVDVHREASGKLPRVVVFDEIQNIPGWEKWVRKISEMKLFQLVITGSSAKMLSQELATSIAARTRGKTIWPLSFNEFLEFNQANPKVAIEYLHWLKKYTDWGAFPEVVLTKSDEEKREILLQYYNDIMIKDIMSRGEIRNTRALELLIRHHFLNVAKHSSANALKKAYGLSIDLIHEYLRLAENAFLLFQVERYHRNLKVQSRDTKKIYAIDTGLRNVNSTSASEDSGHLLENLVYIELRRRFQKIFYFKEKKECDFIVVDKIHPIEAIQVTDSDLDSPELFARETEGLVEALTACKLTSGTLITRNREETLVIDKKTLRLIPAYRWLVPATTTSI